MELAKGMVLTKVHRYRLHRSSNTVDIDVHQVISDGSAKFRARPVHPTGMAASNKDLSVEGDTEQEVIEKLVMKIKDMRLEKIFPKEFEANWSNR